MKKEKTILLGGLILILALGIYMIAWAALGVGNNLNMTPSGKGPFKIIGLEHPSGIRDAATWGYVKNAVNGLDPTSDDTGIWRQNSDANPDIYLGGTVGSNVLSGNVGIGTNDPSEELHIYDTIGSAGIKLQSSSTASDAWSIYNYNDGDEINKLSFYSHVVSDARVANIIVLSEDGRIGIGTTVPRQHLSIGPYLDIYTGAVDDALEYPSIRSSIENLMINGANVYGGVNFNYDRGKGVKFFAHPSDEEVIEIAELNDDGDLYLHGTLGVKGNFLGTDKSYIYGKLGVGKMLNPTASLDVIADTGVSDIFKVSHLASGDFENEFLYPDSDASSPYEFTDPETCDTTSPCYHAPCSYHWQAVNESLSDADCSFIKGAVGEREAIKDLFNISSLTGPVSSIDYVKVVAVCKSTQTTNPAFASPVIKTGGTIYTNETFTELDENYQTITFIANQNPSGGNWDEGDIDALQIGVQARGGSIPPDPPGPPQNPTSFISGTQILMADGSYENIEKIKMGDKVVSYDLDKQLFVDNEVIAITNGHKAYLLINDKLGITLNQKVYIVDKGFIQVREVKIGDYLLNESREQVRINSIRNQSKKVNVYDLVLKSPHNFFAEGYLVHNAEDPLLPMAASGVRCTQVYAEVGYFKSEPTTALVVDSVGKVGIGTSNPGAYILRTHSNGSNEVLVGDDLTVGGTTETDDLHVTDDASIYGNLFCQSTASIGLSYAPANLSVTGNIFVGDDGTGTCDSGHVGKMRYYTYEEATYYYSEFQICMQTDTSSYSWYTIKQNKWGGTPE